MSDTKNDLIWETREGMMSEEEVKRLSAEKGKGAEGEVRAEEAVAPGPSGQEADPAARPDMEGGVRGQYQRKVMEESEK